MPLAEQWAYHSPVPPQPAWPESPARRDIFRNVRLGPTVVYDRAVHVVVQGDRLYFGSSSDDALYCLDAATGNLRWRFTTEGPVRLAPAVADGRVYAASDDGRVYCLDAGGQLVWRHRVGPEDRRLPGNGRIVSLWPVRCGVIVDGGMVYVCAGLFPSQGTYLAALDAKTGEPVWKRQVDISAQGYMAASPSRLFVPTGRTPPHIFDRADGRQLAAFPGAGQQRSGAPEGAGCFAVVVEDQLVHSAGEKGGIQITGVRARERLASCPGLRLIAHGPMAYVLDHGRLLALDRRRYIEMARLEEKKKRTPEEERQLARLRRQRRTWVRWEVPCQEPYELILAGPLLVAGGQDRVVAYRVADGQRVWTAKVDGKAYSLAVSDGRLYVGTDTGAIHCFAPRGRSSPSAAAAGAGPGRSLPEPAASKGPADSVFERAAEIALGAARGDRGYCLVLGAASGRLAEAIARRSRFRVIVVEPDAARAARLRQSFRRAGLYGRQVVVHRAPLDRLPYQKWVANLIVSESALATASLPPKASELWRVLRPCGGALVMVVRSDELAGERLLAWAGRGLKNAEIRSEKGGLEVLTVRRGPVPGAGQWTHLYADSGNSASSGDQLRPGPVRVQWFGRPGPRRMVDRHEKGVGPLYRDGRLFISGDDYLVAVDAYNGTVLWERDLPGSIRLGALKNCGSMAAGEDLLYVAAADQCVGLEAASGRVAKTFKLPPSEASAGAEWGYVATEAGILFGSVTRPGANFRVQDLDTQTLIWRDFQPVVTSVALFAQDGRSGRTLWIWRPHEGVIVNPTIAVAGGRVYCVASTNPETRDVADGRVSVPELFARPAQVVALDARSGQVVWRTSLDLGRLQHIVFLSCARQTLVITGTRNATVGDAERVRYELWGLDAEKGTVLWQATQRPVPDDILDGPHGEQVQHSAIVGQRIYNTGFTLELRTGRPVEGWSWIKSDKCGALTTSAYCGFSRFSNPRMFDLASGRYRSLTQVTRPGCWINIIPAGGLVLIPESSSGCTCYYSIQTSLALAPRDAP